MTLSGEQVVRLVDALRRGDVDVVGISSSNPFSEEMSLSVAHRLEVIREQDPGLYKELRDAAGQTPAPSLALAHAQEIHARGGPGPESWSPELRQEYLNANPDVEAEQAAAREKQLLEKWAREAEESRLRQEQRRTMPNPTSLESLRASRIRSEQQLRATAGGFQ